MPSTRGVMVKGGSQRWRRSNRPLSRSSQAQRLRKVCLCNEPSPGHMLRETETPKDDLKNKNTLRKLLCVIFLLLNHIPHPKEDRNYYKQTIRRLNDQKSKHWTVAFSVSFCLSDPAAMALISDCFLKQESL